MRAELRSPQVKALIRPVERDEEVVENITSDKHVGAVSRNTSDSGQFMAFDYKSHVIDRTARIAPIVTARSNVSTRNKTQIRHNRLWDDSQIGCGIQLPTQATASCAAHGMTDGYVSNGGGRVKRGA